jgi:hypothetical protein
MPGAASGGERRTSLQRSEAVPRSGLHHTEGEGHERPRRAVPLHVLISRMHAGGRPPDPGIKSKRQKVTLMLDSRVYRKVRALVDPVKGISVSDIVSDLLAAVIDELGPLFTRMVAAKNHTERLQLLDEFYAEASGAQALEYARTYTALMAAREREDEE